MKALNKACREKGTILIVVLWVIVVMLILVMPLLVNLSNQSWITGKSFKSLAALNMAEAGVERTIWELNERGGWVSSWVEVEEGCLTLTIDDFSSSDGRIKGDIDISLVLPEGQACLIEAKGRVPLTGSSTVERTVRVNIDRLYDSIFDFGVFADEGFHMNSNTVIDSYDSLSGFYEDQERGSKGYAGTNSNERDSIVLDSNARIFGNVAAGAGTTEEQLDSVINTSAPGTYIEGRKYMLKEPFEMNCDSSLEKLIDNLDYKGDFITGKTENTVLGESDCGTYSSFVIDKNCTVTVEGNVTVYVTGIEGETGEFRMENNSTLQIADDGHSTLTLIFGRTTFLQKSNSSVNNLSKIPSNLLILGTSEFDSEIMDEMHWNSNTDLFGAIVLPNAYLHYDSNYDLYGSIVCRYIDFNSNASIHYDEALGELDTIEGGIPRYAVKSWQEKRS